jgi:hypothetical protein
MTFRCFCFVGYLCILIPIFTGCQEGRDANKCAEVRHTNSKYANERADQKVPIIDPHEISESMIADGASDKPEKKLGVKHRRKKVRTTTEAPESSEELSDEDVESIENRSPEMIVWTESSSRPIMNQAGIQPVTSTTVYPKSSLRSSALPPPPPPPFDLNSSPRPKFAITSDELAKKKALLKSSEQRTANSPTPDIMQGVRKLLLTASYTFGPNVE